MKESIKISIVTPVYNCEEYIERCILSIKNQGYSNFEHIIVDGGSTDATLDIIKKYEGTYNMRYISEKDNGMYDAICKGFEMATGDVYAWLNADDMYMPWAFDVVENVFRHNPQVKWLSGIPSERNEDDVCYKVAINVQPFHRKWIEKGYYDWRVIIRFVQQESTFFAKELWNKHGQSIRQYNLAGDFHLWRHFAQDEELYIVNTVISSFRIRKNQKSSNYADYRAEIGINRKGLSLRLMRKIVKIQSYFVLRKDKQLILKYVKDE